MIALELSGVHIKQKVRITYRFKSWKKDRPDSTLEGFLGDVRHSMEGYVMVIVTRHIPSFSPKGYYDSTKIPFDAVVEVLE